MKRFLVIQTAFLGDVILATPIVEELARLFPDAQIDFLVKKGNESLLKNHPKIATVFTFDKENQKFRNIFRLIRQFRRRHYDEIINLHRFASSGLLTVLSGAKKTVGFDKNPLSRFYSKRFPHLMEGQHEVERILSLIADLGGVSKSRPQLYTSASDYEKVAVYQQQPYYCMAPASVWFTKQLPEYKWVQLIHFVPKEMPIYLVGGPNDRALCEKIQQMAKSENVHILAGKLNLLQSVALFEKAKRTYVNDSGPLHLCSAVNAPVTAFFLSTIPKFGFGPLSDDSIIKQIDYDLYCRPCGLHGFKACPEGHFKCAHDLKITQEDVL